MLDHTTALDLGIRSAARDAVREQADEIHFANGILLSLCTILTIGTASEKNTARERVKKIIKLGQLEQKMKARQLMLNIETGGRR